jgi:hypothetical protein
MYWYDDHTGMCEEMEEEYIKEFKKSDEAY